MKKWLSSLVGNKKGVVLSGPAKAPVNDTKQEQRLGGDHDNFVQLQYSLKQSCGKVRDHNEDTALAIVSQITGADTNTAVGLFIVADGMGGHDHGEQASKVAVETLSNYFIQNNGLSISRGGQIQLREESEASLKSAIIKAHEAVSEQVPGGGTTLTAALVKGGEITIVHAGDSRAYILHKEGNLELLTKDHSLVQRLVDLGQISEIRAAADPRRNILYRALGQIEQLEPDVFYHTFPIDSLLILCSDGLWGVLSENEMKRMINGAPSIAAACKCLVDAANRAGGPDNITVMLVRLVND